MSGPPEEPESGDPGRDEGGADPEEPESPLRGWIDPDDRLWRHPSEQVPAVRAVGPVLSPPPKHRYRGALMVFVAAGALAAAGVFLVILLSPASQPVTEAGHDASEGATLTTLTSHMNAVPAVARTAAKSMVELRVTTTHGTVTLIGVAVAEGGMVATTAEFLSGVQRIDMVAAGGKLERASIVGTDVASDVALVNVPEDIPVAPFSDDGALSGGAPDLVLGYAAADAANGTDTLAATPGAVTAVAASGTADSGMASITSSPGPTTQIAGEPLLDATGAVVGLLCQPSASDAVAVTFLPTQLVVGVADDLRSGSRVTPGILGVEGSDVPGGAGAKLMTVPSGTPAWGHLQAGEVITAVNSHPVRTFAELRSRLYVLQPGSLATLSVLGAPGTTGTKSVGVTLGHSS